MPAVKKKPSEKNTETVEKEKPEKKTSSVRKSVSKAAEEKTEEKPESETRHTRRKAADEKPESETRHTRRKAADEKPESEIRHTRKKAEKKAEPKINVVIEYAGRQIMADEVVESVCKAFKEANPDSEVETIDLYIQPEKSMAYYVVNGRFWEDTKVKI